MFNAFRTPGIFRFARTMAVIPKPAKIITPFKFPNLGFPSITPQIHNTLKCPIPLAIPDVWEDIEVDNTLYADSVLRKRRLKMKKHKLRKRRRAQRALMKRLGKI